MRRRVWMSAAVAAGSVLLMAETTPFFRKSDPLQLTVGAPGVAVNMATPVVNGTLVSALGQQAHITNSTLCDVRIAAQADGSSNVTATTGFMVLARTAEIYSTQGKPYVSAMSISTRGVPDGSCGGVVEIAYGSGL